MEGDCCGKVGDTRDGEKGDNSDGEGCGVEDNDSDEDGVSSPIAR